MNQVLIEKQLYDAFQSESVATPEKLADLIAEILGCPITIEDANHQLISYSKHNGNIDEARMSTIVQRQVPDHVVNGLWKSGVMKQLFERDEPVIIPPIHNIGLGNRVAISIWEDNEILGFIWAHTDERDFHEKELQLFKVAADLVKKYFAINKSTSRENEKEFRDFFWQLLLGDIKEEPVILQRAKQLSLSLNGDLSIVVIDFGKEVTGVDEKHAHYLVDRMEQVEIVGRMFDQNQFILLVRLNENANKKTVLHENLQIFLYKINNRLQTDRIVGGSGLIYQTPLDLHYSYQQAKKVVRLKRQFKEELENVFTYEKLGIFQYLDVVYNNRIKENYKNPIIERLKQYDKKNNTELLHSLWIFLESNCNVFDAAKKIHVHPNTLNYRLKRIKEIGDIDLNDPNQKTTVYLDLIIDKLYK